MKLAKAMATVAGLTGLSRIFGFIRDIMTAAILGAGPVADAFFVALKLPNFFRRVTAEGAFSVAFVPLYTEMAEKDGREQADAFASNAFMVMLSILSVVVLAGLAGMPWVISAIAPGFIGDAVRFEAAVELSRVTFPYLLLMSLTALLGGVLNALNRFAPFAFAPVLFNVCLISTLLFSGYFANAGEALSYGVLGAGVLQLVWLVVAARRSGVRLRFKRPVFDLKIRRVFKLMGPGVIGAGVIHINLFADMIIASFLGAGSISYLYYADRLNQLPLGVVGIAVGTALLPMLSKALAKGDMDEGRDLFNRALEMCLLLALPAAAALAFFGRDLVGGLFERGAFDYQDSQATVMVLTGYALGLPAYICVKVFSTVHWASQDTKTPVKISVIATVINIALSLLLIQYIGVAGIALATGLTGWLQFIFHVKALKGKRVEFDDRLKRASLKIFWATGLMVGGVVFLMLAIDNDYEMSKMQRMIITVVSGLGIYSVFVFVFGLVNLDQLKRFFKEKESIRMKRILSGMQPTSHLHLGNYLGALKNWVALQEEPDSQCLYMVADLHAVTVPQEPEALTLATREIAAAFIAGGIDPSKSAIFVQSAVPGHSELMWLLATMTQMGKLERMTQFKDKAGKNAERAGLGLFAYPVLMAADILLYKTTHVPVGEDQKQHLELARDIAATFNTRFGEDVLLPPEPYIVGEATRVMSLQDGTKKMSKSDDSEKSRINLTDDADIIAKKIKKAQTDPDPLPEAVEGLEGRAGAANLVTIYAALAGISKEDVLAEYGGQGWGVFKPALVELAVEKLSPITARMNELMADPAQIDTILVEGNEKADVLARGTVQEVRDIMGFWHVG